MLLLLGDLTEISLQKVGKGQCCHLDTRSTTGTGGRRHIIDILQSNETCYFRDKGKDQNKVITETQKDSVGSEIQGQKKGGQFNQKPPQA